MPVEKQVLSIDGFCNLLDIDRKRFVGLQVMKQAGVIWILLEPYDESDNRRIFAVDQGREAHQPER